MDTIPSHFRIDAAPEAHPLAVVSAPGARFTVLTSRLIRLEYSPAETFEDRPSQVFWHRYQDPPQYNLTRSGKNLEIETEHLHLVYKPGQGFTFETLTILVKENGLTWHYGDPDEGNLMGTYRTLDQANGPVPLETGLVSRLGWVVVDDSRGLVFNQSGWLEARAAPPETLDLYFFGYGRAYQDCLADFCRVSGPVPLIPRWVLGNWWSRYWAYTQPELTDLVLEFRQKEVPLSVCIIDMDWHLTKTGNQSSGWTGYTWNRTLFPDHVGLIRFLHEQGLHTALNLHPAEGIHPHEEMYPQMAEAMGIDPASMKPVEFDPTDPRFLNAYLEYLHHPQEAAGIDFWWMDWQQGNPTRLPGLNLLWWINHLHFRDLGRDGVKRPFVFSRWGGLGNQRYPIGFSGDTIISWASLAFQPYFTATAANVQYGWWSHDIGGHFSGMEDPELYTRWVQFGVFSPIFRLHCTANPYHERRPWGYDAEVFRITGQAMRLRHALIPYLYSMSWRNYQQGIPLVRPMYHLSPDREEAYACPDTYQFGSELVVAPYLVPRDPDTRLSRQVLWLPEGDWYDFFSGRYYMGDGWYALYGGLDEIPVIARAGAIVPLGPVVGWGGLENPQALTLHVFPGADNRFELYEDDGVSTAYLDGAYAITPFVQSWQEKRQALSLGPAQGLTSLLPQTRDYTIVFHAISPPESLTVTLDGNPFPFTQSYDPQNHTLTVSGLTLAPANEVVIELLGGPSPLAYRNEMTLELVKKLVKSFRMGNETKHVMSSRFSELVADPGLLANYLPGMSNSQLRALFEVLTGAGVVHNTDSGEELIVLWNNRQYPAFTYQVSVEQLRGHWPPIGYRSEHGVAPKFKVFRPAKDFGRYPAAIQVNYGGLFKTVITHRMNDMYPRPKPENY